MQVRFGMQKRELPDECLFARLRGRRARMIRDWRSIVDDNAPFEYLASPAYEGFVQERSPDGLGRSLQREYAWVASRMSASLLRGFEPFFLYAELQTLVQCLRALRDRDPERVRVLLSASILPAELASACRDAESLEQAIGAVERYFFLRVPAVTGLADSFDEGGLRAFERRLVNECCAFGAAQAQEPVVRAFFQKLADARNCMTLWKAVRFASPEPELFIRGGSISLARLSALREAGDIVAAASLIRELTREPIQGADPASVERALYRAITRALRREGRDPLGAGLVLDYLWRCSLEVMNLRVILHTKHRERQAVADEVVT